MISAEYSFPDFHSCLPQPGAWNNIEKHWCLLGEAHGCMSHPQIPHISVGFRALHIRLAPVRSPCCCLQQAKGQVEEVCSPSSSDVLGGFSSCKERNMGDSCIFLSFRACYSSILICFLHNGGKTKLWLNVRVPLRIKQFCQVTLIPACAGGDHSEQHKTKHCLCNRDTTVKEKRQSLEGSPKWSALGCSLSNIIYFWMCEMLIVWCGCPGWCASP